MIRPFPSERLAAKKTSGMAGTIENTRKATAERLLLHAMTAFNALRAKIKSKPTSGSTKRLR